MLHNMENHLVLECIEKYGKTPNELSRYLQENKLTITEFARRSGKNNSTVGKHFKKYGVHPYKLPLAEKAEFICKNCNTTFVKVVRNSPIYNQFCSQSCFADSQVKEFDESNFRFNTKEYEFFAPDETLGTYDIVGKQKNFRNKEICNHFFFKYGIINKIIAYPFGVMLGDGNTFSSKKSATKTVSISQKDHDIAEKISELLNYTNELKIVRDKYKELRIHSPYLFNDLVALGCVPNKSLVVNYPLIPDSLDSTVILGLIDADGSWFHRNSQLFLAICGNEKLMYGVYLKIKKHLNITPSHVWYPIDHNDCKSESFMKMLFCSRDSIKIRDWLYDGAEIYGERKHSIAYEEIFNYKKQFTTTHMAAYLGVSVDFIKSNLKKHPHLPVHKTSGGLRYFLKEEKKQWVDFLRIQLEDPKSRLPNKNELINKWQVV